MDKNKVERVNEEKDVCVLLGRKSIETTLSDSIEEGTANALELGLALNEKQGQAA